MRGVESKRRLRLWIGRGAVLVALAAIAAPPAISKLRGPEVPVVEPTRQTIVQRVVAAGRVLPPARVELAGVVVAKVIAVAVDEGDPVTAGQLLIQLDDAQARADRARADAAVDQALARLERVRGVEAQVARQSLREARSRLDLARVQLERAEAMHAAGGVTRQQLDEARTAVEIARAQAESAAAQVAASAPSGSELRAAAAAVTAARAEAAAAEAAVRDRRVVAPADGLILARAVEPGDVVQPGRTLLAMARAGATRIAIEPEERNLARLEVGQRAIASADAFPEQSFEAVVSTIAPAVDPLRGTVLVKLAVPRPPAYLRADMAVSVNIDVARREDALVLPAAAVRDLASAPWVLAVEDGRARRRPVRLGLTGEGAVEIAGGLAGDGCVIVGEVDVADGARVRPRKGPAR
jgi:HlyD family secretion protein